MSMEWLFEDKEVRKEIKDQFLKTIKQGGLFEKKKLKDLFNKDIDNHVDDLMNEVWDDIVDEFRKVVKTNFKLVFSDNKEGDK